MASFTTSEKSNPEDASPHRLVIATYLLSTLNVILAFNYFPLVPFLGWLNYGHGGTPWLPELLLQQILPAGYYLYWHFWYVAALPALASSLFLWRRGGACWPVVLNLATIILYWLVRLLLFLASIRPDIV